jgi:hypothetical protein
MQENENLLTIIENNIDELLVINNFDKDLLQENIKQLSIEYTLDYLFEKASFDDLMTNVFLIEEKVSSGFDFSTADKTIASLVSNKHLIDGIPSELKLKLVNNSELFNYLRTNEDYREVFSKLVNTVPDINKVNSDILKKIVEYKDKYDLDINTETLQAISKNLNINTDTLSAFSPEIQAAVKKDLSEYGLDETTLLSMLGSFTKWSAIAYAVYITFDRTYSSLVFIYYKIYIGKLLKLFKSNEFFNLRITNKLLRMNSEFEECADYGRVLSPVKATIFEKEAFKLKLCFIKYIGSSYLFLLRSYKDYLKYKGVNLTNVKINNIDDLLNIRDERINVNIKNALFNMNRIVHKFLDDNHKHKLDVIFKLVISDNFDINRFDFDDFK